MARGEKQEKRESKKKREKGIIYARTLDIYREAALTTRSHSLSANHSAAAATTLARSRPVNLDPGNVAPRGFQGSRQMRELREHFRAEPPRRVR